jgi:excisionase family DNA binding protein
MAVSTPTVGRGFLRARDAAQFLSVSRRTLGNLTSSGKLPYSRLSGRLVLFKVADLERAVEGFKVEVNAK